MRVKKLLSFLLVMIMTISLLPASVFADIGDGYGQCPHHAEHNAECGFENGGTCNFVCEICVGTVNNLVEQLPDIKVMKQITENEKSELAALVDQIDRAKLNLSDAGREQIDWSAYDTACVVLYMPKGYFGAKISKGYLKSDYTPLPQFAFLSEQGKRTQALSTDLQTMDVLSLDESLSSDYFYLPGGTYKVEEIVDGVWNASMMVDGTDAEQMNFSANAGSLIEIVVQNEPIVISPYWIVYDSDLDNNEGYDDIITSFQEALDDVMKRENGILEFRVTAKDNDVNITGGTFKMRENAELPAACNGNITISGSANITIINGTYNGNITIESGATLNVENGTFSGNINVKKGGTLIIKDGTFSNTPTAENGGTLIVKMPKNITLGTAALSGYDRKNGYKYIYYGVYDNNPIKWRILDMEYKYDKNDTTKTSMLVLSENALAEIQFGMNNTWKGSTVQTWCNGMYNSSFSENEKEVILTTNADDELNDDKLYL